MKTHQNQTIHVGKCTNDIINTIECFGNDTQVVFFSWGTFSRIQKTHTQKKKMGPRSGVMSWVPGFPRERTDNQPIQGDGVANPDWSRLSWSKHPIPHKGSSNRTLRTYTPWKFNIHSLVLKIYHPTQKEAGSSSFRIIFQGLCLLNLGGCIWILMR